MVLFLTLCFFRRDFGEEGDLGHSNEGQAQNLQEHTDDELRQLIGEITYSPHKRNRQIAMSGLTLHLLHYLRLVV